MRITLLNLLASSLLSVYSMNAFSQNSPCDYVNYSDGKFASVNGVRIYYKVFGEGDKTVVLLHSAYRTMESFCEQINKLSVQYRVIAMDTRGHGRSSDNDQAFTYSLFASDVDALMNQLNISSAYIIGTGDGANTAIQLALSFPKRVEKLVISGANLTADSRAVSENILRSVRAATKSSLDSVVIKFYTRFSENPKSFNAFFEKMKKLLLNHPNLTGNELKEISAPTLVIAGDHDFILLENTVKIFKNIPNSYLFVIPGSEHYVLQNNSEMINPVVSDFLDKDFVKLKKY